MLDRLLHFIVLQYNSKKLADIPNEHVTTVYKMSNSSTREVAIIYPYILV